MFKIIGALMLAFGIWGAIITYIKLYLEVRQVQRERENQARLGGRFYKYRGNGYI